LIKKIFVTDFVAEKHSHLVFNYAYVKEYISESFEVCVSFCPAQVFFWNKYFEKIPVNFHKRDFFFLKFIQNIYIKIFFRMLKSFFWSKKNKYDEINILYIDLGLSPLLIMLWALLNKETKFKIILHRYHGALNRYRFARINLRMMSMFSNIELICMTKKGYIFLNSFLSFDKVKHVVHPEFNFLQSTVFCSRDICKNSGKKIITYASVKDCIDCTDFLLALDELLNKFKDIKFYIYIKKDKKRYSNNYKNIYFIYFESFIEYEEYYKYLLDAKYYIMLPIESYRYIASGVIRDAMACGCKLAVSDFIYCKEDFNDNVFFYTKSFSLFEMKKFLNE
jgi:glycosyltransferase involved in cell wall biosynthesis